LEKVKNGQHKTIVKIPNKWMLASGPLTIILIEFLNRDIFLTHHPDNLHIGISLAIEWAVLALLLLFWIPRVELKQINSLGFGRLTWKYLVWGVLVYIVYLLISYGASAVLNSMELSDLRSLQPMLKEYSYPTLVGLFLTGTFFEEIIYRGYIIERFTLLTGKSWIGGLISWATFTFVHIQFFGLGPTLEVGILSIGLVLLYVRTRSLWPSIITHGINDVFAFLISPLL
jgi:membrane protease YdiL (CAAX protease family)